MATLEQVQEIANRGLQDRLSPEKKQRFDEMVNRGLITLSPTVSIPPETAQTEPSALETGLGALETGATLVTGAIAEPLAGLAGAVTAPFVGSEEATQNIEATREALTFQPRTEAGQQQIQQVGEFLQPVGEALSKAEQGLGDTVFEATGSPVLAAAATTIPTIAAEILGFGLAKGVGKTGRAIKERRVSSALKESAPSPDQLFSVSRGVFDELDNLNVTVKPQPYSRFVNGLEKTLRKQGLNNIITPKSFRALQELKTRIDTPGEVSLTELNTLRKIAGNAADSLDPPEKMLGNIIIDKIDNFLSSSEGAFNKPPDLNVDIAKRYRIARNLWGRGRKSETIINAIDLAEDSATGFENGMRNQLRGILRSPTKRNFFNKSEIANMREIVRGTKGANFLKFLGKFGFSEGQTINIVGGSLGLAAGALAGGGTGAAVATGIGSGARFLSRVVGEQKVKAFNQLLAAGKDGRKITKAYLENTPSTQRSAAELSEILMGERVDLSNIPQVNIAQEALRLVQENRRAATQGVTGTEILREGENVNP